MATFSLNKCSWLIISNELNNSSDEKRERLHQFVQIGRYLDTIGVDMLNKRPSLKNNYNIPDDDYDILYDFINWFKTYKKTSLISLKI